MSEQQIREVASIIAKAVDDTDLYDNDHSADYLNEMEAGAKAVLAWHERQVAKALVDAADDYSQAQFTYMGSAAGYVREWLRRRASTPTP